MLLSQEQGDPRERSRAMKPMTIIPMVTVVVTAAAAAGRKSEGEKKGKRAKWHFFGWIE